LRFLQKDFQVQIEIARIGAECFFRRAPAEAGLFEISENLFANLDGRALQPATDGGLMHVQRTCDLQQFLAVEIVGGKQIAILFVLLTKRVSDSGMGSGAGASSSSNGSSRCVRRW
jgi:hypothetical protein